MKRNLILAALFALALAATASAQKADFSGTWTLDASKSKPAETFIESQTLTVTQTATDLTVDRATKRKENPNGGGGFGGGRPGMGGGDGKTTYTLDGKGVKSQVQTQMGSMDVTTTAKLTDKGKLEITRSIATPMGDRSTTEKWWINADGTLTVESERPNRDGGTDTTTRVYKKS